MKKTRLSGTMVEIRKSSGTTRPGHWVMAVYDESKEDGRSVAFYSSPDLKQWKLREQTSKLL